MKPELCAYYDRTRTTDGSSSYGDFGGTSGATPIVAGHLGLALELWTDGAFGNTLPNPGGTRFSNRPHFTTSKAMLIASAKPYSFDSSSTDNRREHQGWGFPDLKYLHEVRDRAFIVNETETLKFLESKSFKVRVGAGESRLNICLTWADPPGNPSDLPTEPERLNDLTLKVTSPDGTVYWGNHHLSEGVASTPGGNADTINTVECVIVEKPMPGNWLLEVSADELLQDGHVETPDIDADFALVALGLQKFAPPRLALEGSCVRLHLYDEIGTAIRRLGGVWEMDRLEFSMEDAGHYYYVSKVHKNRQWAVAKVDTLTNPCCNCMCQRKRAVWISDPVLAKTGWTLAECATVMDVVDPKSKD